MDNPFIKVDNVSFSYNEDNADSPPAVKSLSLEIEKGSFVAVLGHNGSGKSTFAKLLNLILTPDSGHIYIDGTEITNPELTENDVLNIRRKIGMVFQNPDNQLVATLVEEDVAFGPENLGIAPEIIRARVDSALETVGMTEYKRYSPHRLSGGQKQRVAIAGILAMEPECIVFDESTAMLDPYGRDEVMSSILKLNREKGITVVHITHFMEEAMLADRIIVMNEGRLLLDGKPYDVFKQYDCLKNAGLSVPIQLELLFELNRRGYNIPLPEVPSICDCALAISEYCRNLSDSKRISAEFNSYDEINSSVK